MTLHKWLTARRNRLIPLAVLVLLVFSVRIDAQENPSPLTLPPLDWLDVLTLDNFSAAEPLLTITGPNAYASKVSDDQRYFQYSTYTRLSTRWGPTSTESITIDAQTYEQVPNSRIHSPDSYYVAFDYDAGTITRYDTATGDEAQVLFEATRGLIYPHFIDQNNVLYTPQYATCGGDPCVRWFTWDIDTGEPGERYDYGATDDNFRGYTPIPDSDRIFASYCTEYTRTRECLGRVVEVFSLSEGSLKRLDLEPDRWLSMSRLTPDPNNVLLSFGGDHSVSLYDVNTLEEILTLPDAIYTLAFSPDESWLAAGTLDGTLILYETETYTEVRRWKSHNYAITNITWRADGQMLATGGGIIASSTTPDLVRNRGDSVVNVWDVNTGTQLGSYDAGATSVNGVHFSPDGRLLIMSAGPNGEDGSGGQVTFVGLVGALACRVQANLNANLRSGPGTSFGVAGGLAQGQSAISDRTDTDGEGFVWWHLVSGGWIREDLATPDETCDTLPNTP